MPRSGPVVWILLFLGGLLVWAVYFLVFYAFVALACARGFAGASFLGGDVVQHAPLAMTALALAAVALIWWRLRRRADETAEGHRFLGDAGRFIAILSLIAVALGGLPALLLGC